MGEVKAEAGWDHEGQEISSFTPQICTHDGKENHLIHISEVISDQGI